MTSEPQMTRDPGVLHTTAGLDPAAPAERRAAMSAERVARLRAADQEAWCRFFEDYHPVFACAFRLSARRRSFEARSATDALPDAMASFYEAFLRRFAEFRGEAAFRGFLFEAVDYFVLSERRDAKRSALRRHGLEEQATENAIDDRAVAAWTERDRANRPAMVALARCVVSLPRPYRLVVLTVHLGSEAIPLYEAAERLGLEYEAVKKRHQRALAMLRACVTGSEVRGS